MNRQKRWHWILIFTVFALTFYNIVPTVIYYAKPLQSPIGRQEAMKTASEIAERINSMESKTLEWLSSYSELLHLKPLSVTIDRENPQLAHVRFTGTEDAQRYRHFLAKAGALIADPASRLVPLAGENHSKTVTVLRTNPVHFDDALIKNCFEGTVRLEKDGSIPPLYAGIILDRAAEIACLAASQSDNARLVEAVLSLPPDQVPEELLLSLAAQINSAAHLFENLPSARERFCARLTPGLNSDGIERLLSSMDLFRDRMKLEKSALQREKNLESAALVEQKESSFSLAESFLKKYKNLFSNPNAALSYDAAFDALKKSLPPSPRLQTLPLDSLYFSELAIDWKEGRISLILQPDIASLKSEETQQLLINEIARISGVSNETFIPDRSAFTVRLHELADAHFFLVMNLRSLAEEQSKNFLRLLKSEWSPKHPDLLKEHFPIVDAAEYAALAERKKKLCLCIISDHEVSPLPKESLNPGSIYLLARGLDRILEQARCSAANENSITLQNDFSSLSTLLRQYGFYGYSAASLSPDFQGDYLFEMPNAFQSVLEASRENFQTKGSHRYAVLEFSNLEQRIFAQNRIDTKEHEELLKWRDDYNSAQAMPDAIMHYDIPKPQKSVFWSNLVLSVKKYFRGDERKIIRWGLDLSGGKSVQIELRDQNRNPVTSDIDLRQGINELYNRVNKMGVSEVAIRQLGSNIVLDFPGSQSMSASDLVKASSMYFHVVNEKFSTSNPQLAEPTHRFLQEVWNEAIVMNRKDPESVNAIAWKHLHGEPGSSRPKTEAARILYEQGLRLQPPDNPSCSSALDDTVSKIAILRDDTHGRKKQRHPLMIVFANYALEGSSLTNIRSSYDPSKGNFLSFDVKNSSLSRKGDRTNPRSDLQAWTSHFCQDRIAGTERETFTQGRGWRMAVLLNDSIISSPTLNSALQDSAMISGNFTQREVNQLAADLKAGSLTFTPHILSEKNVSPELGKSDRLKGIIAMAAALALVIVAMICYYRFSGVIASTAVIINLLILWATLQNLQATLSLAGIAGIILTVGMAVDANVLVFERIKEEIQAGKHLGTAIAAGYQKAFSAILDSNVTTMIAALILLNFDAGPIKGFAITLIIGIASSMLTALFMTRAYFNRWVEKTKAKTLKMADWVKSSTFDFLKASKAAIATSLLLITIGGFFLIANKTTLFGMDFTGGYALEFEVEPIEQPAEVVSAAFQSAGAFTQDFQIRQLHPSTRLRALFSTAMEQPSKPFYESSSKKGAHGPQIEWVLQALQNASIQLTPESAKQIDSNWIAISGQMSDSMRNNALIGLGIAFACIFVYLTIRFESTYAASAIACLLHDVCVTLGAIGLLHALKVPVQIDLNTIAALMTIIGYSLNDTIIIFDRIREDVQNLRGRPMGSIVNHALNATLSRTSITSGTTLLVLIALVILGGASIFSFALVMTLGVVFGTLSSWFIASPLLLAFQRASSKKDTAVVKTG